MSRSFRIVGALCGAGMLGGASGAPLQGQWGERGVNLVLGEHGGRLDEACSTVTLPPVQLGRQGKFRGTGRLEMMSPGPQDADAPPATTPVAVSGQVRGESLTLTVRVAGAAPRHYALVAGRRTKIIRCY